MKKQKAEVTVGRYTERVVEKPMEIHMTGYEVVEKCAQESGTSGRIYVPRAWIGKLVRAVLIER